MMNIGRREVLQALGTGAVTNYTSSSPATAHQSLNSRYIVDLQKTSRNTLPNSTTIIHDLSEVDLLVVRGDSNRVRTKPTIIPDVKVAQGDAGTVVEQTGPTTNAKKWHHNHDGAAKNTELQWDKRVQNIGDLTDKPGGGKFIHDKTEGKETRVAVVDDGVYDTHPDLASVVNEDISENFTTDPYDFRPHGAGTHGTHAAGTIAATNSNGGPRGGILGTAPKTEIVSLRVFSNSWGATGDTFAALIAAADKGCDVVNLSLGYEPFTPGSFRASFLKEAYRRIVEHAKQHDMVIVNSAGNNAIDMGNEDVVSLPTEVNGIFGVAGTGPIGFGWGSKHDDNEEIWLSGNRLVEPTTTPGSYTNYGEGVDVSAAGGNYRPGSLETNPNAYNDLVYSTIYKQTLSGEFISGYGWKAGTSMAAPQVSGAIALVRSLRPSSTETEVKEYIRETASDAPGGSEYHGAGHLDLKRLLKAVK